jgi:filamentous hemagglutinin family protein
MFRVKGRKRLATDQDRLAPGGFSPDRLSLSAARFRPRLQALLLATSASMALAGAASAQTVSDAQAVGGVQAFAVGGAAGALDVPAGRQLPTGGQVVAGAVALNTAAQNNLTLNQTSDRAIVNFTTFDIAKNYSVIINQPGSRAALLARVTGADGSILAGSLSANGQFALVNPNGIAITNTGIVNTAGFIASTLDIADADFLSGKLTFRRSGKAAAITNQGQIFGQRRRGPDRQRYNQ